MKRTMVIITGIYICILFGVLNDSSAKTEQPNTIQSSDSKSQYYNSSIKEMGTDDLGFPILKTDTTGDCDGEDCYSAFVRQKVEILTLKAKILQEKKDFDSCYSAAMALNGAIENDQIHQCCLDTVMGFGWTESLVSHINNSRTPIMFMLNTIIVCGTVLVLGLQLISMVDRFLDILDYWLNDQESETDQFLIYIKILDI